LTHEGWVEAGSLTLGDQILSLDGTFGDVESISISNDPQVMYNLTVDISHTFAVGEGQWVVHNKNNEKPCQLVRFASKSEATEALQNGRLTFPISGTGNQKEKWITISSYVDSNETFGDAQHYTHRINIFSRAGTIEWLQRNAVDYDYYLEAVKDRLKFVPYTSIRTGDVLVFKKGAEEGRYGLTLAGLNNFNFNIERIEIVEVR
jgi:hypothetical protein